MAQKTDMEDTTSLDNVCLGETNLDIRWMYKFNSTTSETSPNHIKNNADSLMLQEFFNKSDNVYRTVLYLFSRSKDFFKGKPHGIAASVIENFENWLRCNRPSVEHLLEDNDLKCNALQVATLQPNSLLMTKLCKIFRLNETPDLFYGQIKELISTKKYKEACFSATLLNMQEYFDLESFAIPLIVQDKITVVERYVKNHKDLQLALVKYLDNWSGDAFAIGRVLSELEVPNVRRDKLVPKTIGKLVSRLLKLYGIPTSACPNIFRVRSKGALTYLLSKHFQDPNSNWDDMVEDAVGEDVELQKELVVSLMCADDLASAVKWTTHYNLPVDALPDQIQDALKVNTQVQKEYPEEECWDDESETSNTNIDKFYNLNVNRDDIILVDDIDKFENCLCKLTSYDVIGFDAEWKPSFGKYSMQVSLLQLAVHDKIYLIDIITLKSTLEDDDWCNLVDNIFCNENIIKIGFDLGSDLKMLELTIPSVANRLKCTVKLLDCTALIKHLHSLNPVIISDDALTSAGDCSSLSNVVRVLFGKALNKDEQFSDWEKRPLRETQTIYAALDAYCLLQVYVCLSRRCEDNGLNFQEVVRSVVKNLKKQKKKPVKVKKLKQVPVWLPDLEKLPRDTGPTQSQNFYVVCDTMLQGLGKKLRLCGIDTRILDNDEDHDMAAKMAVKESRVLLTAGSPYDHLKNHVPEGMCYQVSNISSANDQLTEVLSHFNVVVTRKDILSRCISCNGCHYVIMPAIFVKEMWIRKNQSMKSSGRPESNPSKLFAKDMHFTTIPRFGEFEGGQVDIDMGRVVETGADIQLDNIELSVLNSIKTFYVCSNCGKVFWDGSHFGRVIKNFGHLLTQHASDDQNLS